MLDRYIITLGGIERFRGRCVNDVECYDTLANQWFRLTSLPEENPSTYSGLVTRGNLLIAIPETISQDVRMYSMNLKECLTLSESNEASIDRRKVQYLPWSVATFKFE